MQENYPSLTGQLSKCSLLSSYGRGVILMLLSGREILGFMSITLITRVIIMILSWQLSLRIWQTAFSLIERRLEMDVLFTLYQNMLCAVSICCVRYRRSSFELISSNQNCSPQLMNRKSIKLGLQRPPPIQLWPFCKIQHPNLSCSYLIFTAESAVGLKESFLFSFVSLASSIHGSRLPSQLVWKRL